MLNESAAAPITTATVRRTRIVHRDFICKSDAHHEFRAAVKIGVTDDGTQMERTAQFLCGTRWLPLPLCTVCNTLSEERATYDPNAAAVPEAERMKAWLSPDGKSLAIPLINNAVMPERYANIGYTEVVAHSMRDIDRFQSIRAEQTGNSVDSELNYDRPTRAWHEDKPYDPDDMTSAW